jgi:hypothetical protein
MTQVETLRRLKNGGSQIVRVEHVHVNEGGQALIGNVRKDGSGEREGENEASKRLEGRLSHLACRISCHEGLTLAAPTATVSSFATDALVTASSTGL